jgi:glycosyltransferase involved in cell wall biosynthesis
MLISRERMIMKILFITIGFPPRHWAGTETYTAAIANELIKRGHEVQVLCGGDWDTGPNYWNGYTDDIYKGIPVRRLNLNWAKAPDPFLYLYNNPVVANYLTGYLDEVQPDLVHVTSCETLSASVLRVAQNAGLPLVLSHTDFWFICPRRNLLRSDGINCDGLTSEWECLHCQLRNTKIYRWSSRLLPESGVSRLLTRISHYPLLTRQRGLRGMAGNMAERKSYLREALEIPDRRIIASPFVNSIFVSNGITNSVKVHPYGHELSWLENYVDEKPSDKISIGFVGQIARFKGVHLLLQATRALQYELGGKFSLRIYGNIQHDPEYGAELHALAADMDDVEFCGTYPREESAAVYGSMDVLVVPSLWYDFPLVIYEAFATKTPVVATNLGGMAEAVSHEVSGLLFERDNVDDLTGQLRRIITEPDLLGKLREGIPSVKTTTEEVTELEEIYLDIARV